MSLFEWSTPERRGPDRTLPVIPNEIYLYIFEHIAPSTRCLKPKELRIFAKLCRVCRYFANVCLPQIFEFVSFSGHIIRDDTSTALRDVLKTLPGTTLYTQIVAKQPLAHSLAEVVKVCHFADWQLGMDSSVVQLMSYMNNVRELKFFHCVMDTKRWNTIATLGSLEDLSFVQCNFLQQPVNVEAQERVKIKVSRLYVARCTGNCQQFAAIDPRYLRVLDADWTFFEQVDWLPRSALAELRLCFQHPMRSIQDLYTDVAVFIQDPVSLETLDLLYDTHAGLAQDMVRRLLDSPTWNNFPLLHSMSLQIHSLSSEKPSDVASSALERIGLLTGLQSFTLKDFRRAPEISPTEVRRILHDKLAPGSCLRYADIHGKAFRLADGEWSEVSSSAI